MAEKQTIKSPFGELSVEDHVISMSQSQLIDAYEQNGLPNAKETLKAVDAARDKIVEKAGVFLSEQVKKDLQPWTLKAGQKNDRIKLTLKPEGTVTIPGRNGEAPKQEVRYCPVDFRTASKAPTALFENKEFLKNCDEIEQKLKAKVNAKPQIKIA